MATRSRPRSTRWYRLIAIALAALIVAAATVALVPTPTQGQVAIELDTLDVPDHDETVSGNVTDATLAADIRATHDVPDATQRVIQLKVGTSEDDLETIDYIVEMDPSGTADQTVSLDGSLTDHSAIDAETLDPARASTEQTEIVVAATVEIERENGDTVTETITQPVTITLTDEGDLVAEIGGTGSITIETDA